MNTLILNITAKDMNWSEIEQELEEVFNSKPQMIQLPISKEIEEVVINPGGEMKTYKFPFGIKNFPKSVFELLIDLEKFGIDWKFRSPIQIFPPKHLFIASISTHFGKIYLKGVTGISVQLYEGEQGV